MCVCACVRACMRACARIHAREHARFCVCLSVYEKGETCECLRVCGGRGWVGGRVVAVTE